MPSSGYRKQTVDFGDMALDLQRAAASFTQMSAAAASFVSFVNAFKAFELQITKVNSAVGGTAQTFKQLSDAARGFALVSKYSAGEAASSMVMLAQAGFSAQEAMSAMPSILQLAQASMENLDLVADTVASTIRTYNLNAEDAARVTNLFAASAVNSLATVNKLAFSFRQVGPVAAELGLSVEQTAAALDILYNRGLRGEQAGTALRNILIRLIKPTQDTYDAFYRLGIALNDSNGQLRNYQDILKDLGTKKVSDTYLTKMFGREALAGAKTLIAATTGEYQKMLETITDTNTAARMANAQMKTMDGSLKLIRNSLTELGIILGESVGPIVKTLADYVQSFAITLRTMDKDTISTVKNLAVFTSSLYLVQKAISAAYIKLVPFATTINKMLNRSTIQNVWDWFRAPKEGLTNNGLVTQQGLVQLWNIAQQGGKDWYTNMNELYKSMNNGKGLAMMYAVDIKNMSKAEMEATKATLLLGKGFKALLASLKAVGLAFLKLTPVMLVAWGAFKLYDNWAKERERKAQMKEDLFPELTTMVDKLKEAKLAVNKDLPDIVASYKANMEVIAAGRRTAANVESFFSNYGLTNQNRQRFKQMGFSDELVLEQTYYKKVKEFSSKLKESVINRQKLTAEEFYKLGEESGLEYNVLNEFWKGYDSIYKEAQNKTIGDNATARASYISAIVQNRFRDRAEDVLSIMNKGYKESLENVKKANEQQLQDFYKEQQLIFSGVGAGSNSFINSILTKQDLKRAENKSITDAYVRFIYGIPKDANISTWFKEHFDEAFEKYKAAKNENQDKILESFKDSDFFKALPENVQGFIRVPMEINATANLQVNPLNLTAQENIVEQLKKQYADLLSDYKLSWELLSQSEFSYEKIATLQRQIDLNNQELSNTTDKVFSDIFQKVGRVFNKKAADDTLKAWTESMDILAKKEELLKTIEGTVDAEGKKVENLTEEQKKYIELKLLELEIQYKIAAQKNKEIEQEQHLYDMEEGRYIYQKGYLENLDNELKRLDTFAKTEFFSKENFTNGIEAGVITVAKEVDTSYDMMKQGMKGFADFMTDSMNAVVDNWTKGWDSMKDALKNTLADMLRDLSHYYMKQAIYMGITSLAGAFGGSAANTGIAGTVGGNQIINSDYVGPLASNQYYLTKKNGGAFQNGLQTFANGGVVTGPTLFNHRFGKGLMGEAGPEAIMPLKRDSQGRLGVQVSGGGSLNYAPTFNINMATGTMDTETSQRNTTQMTKELDNKVKSAVLLVLAKEKRPGGLLYGAR